MSSTKGQHLLEWQKDKVAQQLASGQSRKDIREDWDISVQTLVNIKKQKRELIEKYANEYFEALPDAVKIQVNLVKDMKSGSIDETIEPVRYNAAMKAAENVLKAAGIMPGKNVSVHIQKIFNDNSVNSISPEVINLLGKLNDIEIIDV